MSNGMIKNTLVFKFPEDAAAPTVVEMARFVKAFDADKRSMECTYKISDERVVCIKFRSESAMKDALLHNPEIHTFHYSNGKSVEVAMSVAGGCIRYVRVFDLPPELSDLDVSLVLGKFGTVKRMVREKFPPELELDLFTGVRGIYMDIKSEIPSSLYFLNRRGRIYYDGLKLRCYLCKQEEHRKAKCPQKAARRVVDEQNVEQVVEPLSAKDNRVENTYSAIVAGTSSAKKNDDLQLSMVKLVSSNATESVPENEENYEMVIEALEGQEDDGESAAVDETGSGDVIRVDDSEPESNEEETETEKERSTKRPLESSGKSESEDGNDKFITIDRSRKSRKQLRAAEAELQNVLEVMAAKSSGGSKSRGSNSKSSNVDRSRSRSSVKASVSDANVEKC